MPITIVEEQIGPALARAYLSKNHPNNRTARQGAVDVFAADMQEGRWQLSHQGIAFDDKGFLIDGANRMRAIVKADTTVAMMVARGLTAEAVQSIDNNSKRTVADALKIAGRPNHSMTYTAVLGGMFGFTQNKTKRSYSASLALEEKYREAVEFAATLGGYGGGDRPKGLISGHLLGPIARAYYTADRERLREFIYVVKTGFGNGRKDDAAIALRNWLLRVNVPHERTEIYRKTESALKAFLESQPIEKVYETRQELFPIPE